MAKVQVWSPKPRPLNRDGPGFDSHAIQLGKSYGGDPQSEAGKHPDLMGAYLVRWVWMCWYTGIFTVLDQITSTCPSSSGAYQIPFHAGRRRTGFVGTTK